MMGLIGVVDGNYCDHSGEALSLADIEMRFGAEILDGTLIRRIDKTFFDVDAAHWQKSATLGAGDAPLVVEMRRRDLPEPDVVADLRNVVAGDLSPDGKGELAMRT